MTQPVVESRNRLKSVLHEWVFLADSFEKVGPTGLPACWLGFYRIGLLANTDGQLNTNSLRLIVFTIKTS